MNYVLPVELIEALDKVSTRIKKQHAAKFCSLIINNLQHKGLNLDGYVDFPTNYIQTVFNSRYNEWLKELIELDIVQEYVFGFSTQDNNQFKKVYFIPCVGKSKRYRINPELLTDNFQVFFSTDENPNEHQSLIDELNNLTINIAKLMDAVDTIVDKKLKALNILDKTYPTKLLLNVKMNGVNYDKMSLEKALVLASENNMVVIKDKRKFEISNIEDYIQKKSETIRFFMLKSIKSLAVKNYFTHRNERNQRLDYNFTNMSKDLMKIILKDNHKSEIDLSNSQFSILSNILIYTFNKSQSINKSQSLTFNTTNTITYNYVHTFFENDVIKAVLDRFNQALTYYVSTFTKGKDAYYVHTFLNDFKTELDAFANACFEGKLYQFVNKCTNRTDGKLLMMEIAFSKEGNKSANKKDLKDNFPHIIGFIDTYKKMFDYEEFSVALQQVESVLFIDTILPVIQKEYSCLPKHDSLIVDTKNVEQIIATLKSVFDEIGFKYHFKIDDVDYKRYKTPTQSEPNNEIDMKEETSNEQLMTSQDVPMNLQQFRKENFEKFLFSNHQVNIEYEKYLDTFSKQTECRRLNIS